MATTNLVIYPYAESKRENVGNGVVLEYDEYKISVSGKPTENSSILFTKEQTLPAGTYVFALYIEKAKDYSAFDNSSAGVRIVTDKYSIGYITQPLSNMRATANGRVYYASINLSNYKNTDGSNPSVCFWLSVQTYFGYNFDMFPQVTSGNRLQSYEEPDIAIEGISLIEKENHIIELFYTDSDYVHRELKFDNDSILSLNVVKNLDVIGSEANVSTLDAEVYYDDSNRILRNAPFSTIMWLYNGATYFCTMYLISVERTAKTQYRIHAEDLFGVLDRRKYYGGFWYNVSFQNVLNNIFHTNGMRDDPADYVERNEILWAEFNDGVANISIYGWLPVCTKREALQQLLFAANVSMFVTQKGHLIFSPLMPNAIGTIETSKIYSEGSVEEIEKVNIIELTEHSYITNNTEVKTLFDNTGVDTGSNEYVVLFEEAPIYDASITMSSGLTVISSNVNGAIVRGSGKISGRIYTHEQNVISKVISNNVDGKTVTVQNATLVTFANSTKVMEKLADYYEHAYKVSNSIVYSGESIGSKYNLQNPFEETDSGYLASANMNFSGIIKANCEFVGGITPVSIGADYDSFVVLTGTGTFTVPQSVFNKPTPKFKVVLIGGGNGGDSGYAGDDSEECASWEETGHCYGGEGGNYGDAGSAGKVYETVITNPAQTYSYSCGIGGTGGAICRNHKTNNKGAEGGFTRFGMLSSANGTVRTNGITNQFNGETYASVMLNWDVLGGGVGGNGCSISGSDKQPDFEEAEHAFNGFTGEVYTGGVSGSAINTGVYYQDRDGYDFWLYTGGGGAGGSPQISTYDINGGDAWRERRFNPNLEPGYNYYNEHVIHVGTPGKYNQSNEQFKFVPPKATEYNPRYFGYGGMGGFGGGGGGAVGIYSKADSDYHGYVIDKPSKGTGGAGTPGGDGGDGCIIVYY